MEPRDAGPQHVACNMSPATCRLQHVACSMSLVACCRPASCDVLQARNMACSSCCGPNAGRGDGASSPLHWAGPPGATDSDPRQVSVSPVTARGDTARGDSDPRQVAFVAPRVTCTKVACLGSRRRHLGPRSRPRPRHRGARSAGAGRHGRLLLRLPGQTAGSPNGPDPFTGLGYGRWRSKRGAFKRGAFKRGAF
jgi:hypothetical protein